VEAPNATGLKTRGSKNAATQTKEYQWQSITIEGQAVSRKRAPK
jgi:hypothetical protein